MDGERFDAVVRTFAAASLRRHVLRAIGNAALAIATVRLADDTAALSRCPEAGCGAIWRKAHDPGDQQCACVAVGCGALRNKHADCRNGQVCATIAKRCCSRSTKKGRWVKPCRHGASSRLRAGASSRDATG